MDIEWAPRLLLIVRPQVRTRDDGKLAGRQNLNKKGGEKGGGGGGGAGAADLPERRAARREGGGDRNQSGPSGNQRVARVAVGGGGGWVDGSRFSGKCGDGADGGASALMDPA